MEIRRIQKSGNSYHIYVPKEFIERFGLHRASFVAITLERDGIYIRPLALSNPEGLL